MKQDKQPTLTRRGSNPASAYAPALLHNDGGSLTCNIKMTTENPKIEVLKKQAEELAGMEILTETNSGTYSQVEAKQTCGSGDPRYSEYRIYTRVGDGRERREGCAADEAPGVARRFREALSDAQRDLRQLRKQIARAGCK